MPVRRENTVFKSQLFLLGSPNVPPYSNVCNDLTPSPHFSLGSSKLVKIATRCNSLWRDIAVVKSWYTFFFNKKTTFLPELQFC